MRDDILFGSRLSNWGHGARSFTELSNTEKYDRQFLGKMKSGGS